MGCGVSGVIRASSPIPVPAGFRCYSTRRASSAPVEEVWPPLHYYKEEPSDPPSPASSSCDVFAERGNVADGRPRAAEAREACGCEAAESQERQQPVSDLRLASHGVSAASMLARHRIGRSVPAERSCEAWAEETALPEVTQEDHADLLDLSLDEIRVQPVQPRRVCNMPAVVGWREECEADEPGTPLEPFTPYLQPPAALPGSFAELVWEPPPWACKGSRSSKRRKSNSSKLALEPRDGSKASSKDSSGRAISKTQPSATGQNVAAAEARRCASDQDAEQFRRLSPRHHGQAEGYDGVEEPLARSSSHASLPSIPEDTQPAYEVNSSEYIVSSPLYYSEESVTAPIAPTPAEQEACHAPPALEEYLEGVLQIPRTEACAQDIPPVMMSSWQVTLGSFHDRLFIPDSQNARFQPPPRRGNGGGKDNKLASQSAAPPVEGNADFAKASSQLLRDSNTPEKSYGAATAAQASDSCSAAALTVLAALSPDAQTAVAEAVSRRLQAAAEVAPPEPGDQDKTAFSQGETATPGRSEELSDDDDTEEIEVQSDDSDRLDMQAMNDHVLKSCYSGIQEFDEELAFFVQGLTADVCDDLVEDARANRPVLADDDTFDVDCDSDGTDWVLPAGELANLPMTLACGDTDVIDKSNRNISLADCSPMAGSSTSAMALAEPLASPKTASMDAAVASAEAHHGRPDDADRQADAVLATVQTCEVAVAASETAAEVIMQTTLAEGESSVSEDTQGDVATCRAGGTGLCAEGPVHRCSNMKEMASEANAISSPSLASLNIEQVDDEAWTGAFSAALDSLPHLELPEASAKSLRPRLPPESAATPDRGRQLIIPETTPPPLPPPPPPPRRQNRLEPSVGEKPPTPEDVDIQRDPQPRRHCIEEPIHGMLVADAQLPPSPADASPGPPPRFTTWLPSRVRPGVAVPDLVDGDGKVDDSASFASSSSSSSACRNVDTQAALLCSMSVSPSGASSSSWCPPERRLKPTSTVTACSIQLPPAAVTQSVAAPPAPTMLPAAPMAVRPGSGTSAERRTSLQRTASTNSLDFGSLPVVLNLSAARGGFQPQLDEVVEDPRSRVNSEDEIEPSTSPQQLKTPGTSGIQGDTGQPETSASKHVSFSADGPHVIAIELSETPSRKVPRRTERRPPSEEPLESARHEAKASIARIFADAGFGEVQMCSSPESPARGEGGTSRPLQETPCTLPSAQAGLCTGAASEAAAETPPHVARWSDSICNSGCPQQAEREHQRPHTAPMKLPPQPTACSQPSQPVDGRDIDDNAGKGGNVQPAMASFEARSSLAALPRKPICLSTQPKPALTLTCMDETFSSSSTGLSRKASKQLQLKPLPARPAAAA
eukprot:TRINITY_DN6571_c0_g3_i1.p1 TRINITY_DN6571_c0_g3~~TRINITY_DN6571_c0_g3_i1.p1  ORF type:complete len:1354 (-),score=255.35 TRINITY_DN6571_c0_g3_i1:48-4109(-)